MGVTGVGRLVKRVDKDDINSSDQKPCDSCGYHEPIYDLLFNDVKRADNVDSFHDCQDHIERNRAVVTGKSNGEIPNHHHRWNVDPGSVETRQSDSISQHLHKSRKHIYQGYHQEHSGSYPGPVFVAVQEDDRVLEENEQC